MAEANHEFAADTEVEEPPSAASRFCNFLYNRDTGAVLGRTGCSWVKIGVFYIIYYSCLAGFFVGMLSVFLYGFVAEDMPYRTGLNSLLNMNPGLGFRPHVKTEDTLIEFTAGKPSSYLKYIANIQQLYDTYQEINAKPDTVNVRTKCDATSEPDNEPMKVCKFDWDRQLPKCTPNNDFGYAIGKPCVIIKLNRIFGWVPDPVNSDYPHALVQCYGENPADTENIGKVIYSPSIEANLTAGSDKQSYGYFNQAYYPYLQQVGYRAPLVALQFDTLQKNTVVMVECRVMNLKNSLYDKVDRDGMVRFEIFMKS